ncbi:MAG: hypothetical protein B7Z14_09030 [Bosea sp. 32-68-6]|nr:MAG: hypothetical protein B7Z14_09030 [Bosea sp. 32-68-6]
MVSGAAGGIGDFAKNLVTKGFIPVFGPALMSGIGFAFKGAFSLAGSALSAVSGIALSLAKSVLGIGVAAVKAGGQMVMWLGRTALNALRGVGSFVTSLVGKVTGLATRIAAVSAAAIGAAAIFGNKAINAAAEYTGSVTQAAQSSGMSEASFQTLAAAARKFNVDVNDLRSSMVQFQGQVVAAARDPNSDLGKYFSQIGVSAKDASGRIRTTGDILTEVLTKAQVLDETSRIAFLSQMFGEDDITKLMPLINELLGDAELLNKVAEKQKRLGSFITPVDTAVMKVVKESLGDLTDAFKGLQLAIARQAGPFLARTFRDVATFIAEYREQIGYGFGVLFAGIRDFAQDVMTIVRGGWGGMFDNVADEATQTANALAYARREGMAWIRVITQPSIKNRWLIDVREGLAWVRYLAIRALPPVKTFFAALFGNQAANNKLPWVDTLKNGVFYVSRLLRETLLTLGGDDSMVTEFPWLLKLRAALGTAGRLVGEFFYLVTGDSGRVKEFPWLLKLQTQFNSTVTYLKRLWFEASSAFMGRDFNVATQQFPWIFTIRDAFFKLVGDVKLVWQDLVGIFGGGSAASTTIGQWVVWLQGEFTKAKTTFFEFVTYAQQAWADIQKVLSGDAAGAFNFEALRGVASFISDLSTAFGIFETVLTGIYRGVEFIGMAIGKVFGAIFGWVPTVFNALNGRVVALTAGLFLLSGVGRLVFGVFAVGYKIIKALAGVLGAGGAAAGAIAGAGSAAGAAVGGAGAVGAVAALGAATARAGDAAAGSVSKWGRLGEILTRIGGIFKRMPWLAKFLGLGSIASLAIDTATDGDASFWGSIATGAGAGAFVGGRAGPIGAVAGGAVGTVLGYRNYLSDDRAQRIAEARRNLGVGPATEGAFDKSNSLAEGTTSRSIDELAVGMGSLEAELASIKMDGTEIPGLSGVGGPNSLQAITQMFADIQAKAANGNIPNPAAFAGSYVGMGGYSDPMAIWSQGAMARAQAAAPWNNPATYGTQVQQPQSVPQTPVTFVLPGGEVVQGYLADDQLSEARRVSRHYTGRN